MVFYKKPLRSFQELEVYQKTLEASVILTKKITEAAANSDVASSKKVKLNKKLKNQDAILAMSSNFGSGAINDLIIKTLLNCSLGIPHLIAEAHSLRFADHGLAIGTIEKALLNCNKVIVYIEQARDICDTGIEWEFFDDLIKKYLYARRKILNLGISWKKYMPEFGGQTSEFRGRKNGQSKKSFG